MGGDFEKPPEFDPNSEINSQVNAHRKGCNKHFKDELLLKGWSVGACPPPEEGMFGKHATAEWCPQTVGIKPEEYEVDSFSKRNEAAFYACEHTIGKYGHEI